MHTTAQSRQSQQSLVGIYVALSFQENKTVLKRIQLAFPLKLTLMAKKVLHII